MVPYYSISFLKINYTKLLNNNTLISLRTLSILPSKHLSAVRSILHHQAQSLDDVLKCGRRSRNWCLQELSRLQVVVGLLVKLLLKLGLSQLLGFTVGDADGLAFEHFEGGLLLGGSGPVSFLIADEGSADVGEDFQTLDFAEL